MATCRDIVALALRKLGVLGGGREPRDADRTDAFDGLRSLYPSLLNVGAFGRLTDVVPVGLSYVAAEGVRVLRTGPTLVQVTLPEIINDGGYARPPRDCAVVAIQDEASDLVATWIYDGHSGNWLEVEALTIDSIAPLSSRDPQGLGALLATSIADQFGVELNPVTVQASRVFLSALTHRYSTVREAVTGVYC